MKLEPHKITFPQFPDERGMVSPLKLKELFPETNQINYVVTKPGSLRGLHFQYPPFEQSKIVYCLSGHILDVAVDLDTGSVHAIELQPGEAVSVPCGYAHGFQNFGSEDAAVLYIVDNDYSPKNEGGVIWNDPKLKIPWKPPAKGGQMILSKKDKSLPTFDEVAKNYRR